MQVRPAKAKVTGEGALAKAQDLCAALPSLMELENNLPTASPPQMAALN